MNKIKIAHYISTSLMTALFGFGAVMYLAQYEEVAKAFTALGYPTHIIYPLAVTKLLALLAIWTRKSPLLKDLAYAGLFYDLILAALAHFVAADGGFASPLFGLVLVVTSFATQRSPAFANTADKAHNSGAPIGAPITS